MKEIKPNTAAIAFLFGGIFYWIVAQFISENLAMTIIFDVLSVIFEAFVFFLTEKNSNDGVLLTIASITFVLTSAVYAFFDIIEFIV